MHNSTVHRRNSAWLACVAGMVVLAIASSAWANPPGEPFHIPAAEAGRHGPGGPAIDATLTRTGGVNTRGETWVQHTLSTALDDELASLSYKFPGDEAHVMKIGMADARKVAGRGVGTRLYERMLGDPRMRNVTEIRTMWAEDNWSAFQKAIDELSPEMGRNHPDLYLRAGDRTPSAKMMRRFGWILRAVDKEAMSVRYMRDPAFRQSRLARLSGWASRARVYARVTANQAWTNLRHGSVRFGGAMAAAVPLMAVGIIAGGITDYVVTDLTGSPALGAISGYVVGSGAAIGAAGMLYGGSAASAAAAGSIYFLPLAVPSIVSAGWIDRPMEEAARNGDREAIRFLAETTARRNSAWYTKLWYGLKFPTVWWGTKQWGNAIYDGISQMPAPSNDDPYAYMPMY